MKRILGLLVAAALILGFIGCGVTSEFIKTGQTYPVLDPSVEVKVYMTGKPVKYSEIGILNTSGGDLSERIEMAKQEARKVGANGIIPKETVTKKQQVGDTKYKVQYNDLDGSATVQKEQSMVEIEEQQFILIKVEG